MRHYQETGEYRAPPCPLQVAAMFNLRLRPRGNDANDSSAYRVILVMEDGYELDVGGIGKRIGTGARDFWVWSALNRSGEASSRDEAITPFRASWPTVIAETIAEMRRQQE